MINITETDVTFERIYNSAYMPKDDRIKEAVCLIIPYKNFRTGVEYCYSEYAEEILDYIAEKQELTIDIAATDDFFHPIQMHSLLLDLGAFILMDIHLPLLVNLTASFIYDKMKYLHIKDTEIHVEYIVQKKDGNNKSITYSGPASEFSSAMKIIKKL